MKKFFIILAIIATLIIATFVVVWAIFFRVKVTIVYANSIVFIEPSADVLKIDEEGNLKRTLRVQILPKNTFNKGVDFASSDSGAVRVTRITDSEAEVELLKASSMATITARTRDGTNLTATIKIVAGIDTNRVITYNGSGFNDDKGLYNYENEEYAFYKDYTYTIQGARSISCPNAITTGNKITFNNEGTVSLLLTTDEGVKTISGIVTNRIDVLTTPLTHSDIIGSDNIIVTAKTLTSTGLKDISLGNELKATLSQTPLTSFDLSFGIFDTFINQNVTLDIFTPHQNLTPITLSFILKRGTNCYNFHDLKSAYQSLDTESIILANNITVTADDISSLLNAAKTSLLPSTESILIRNTSVIIYGNNFTLDFSLLPRLASPNTSSVAFFKAPSAYFNDMIIKGNAPQSLSLSANGLFAFNVNDLNMYNISCIDVL